MQIAGAAYHVTARGVARLPLFRDDDDRITFLKKLAEVCHRQDWLCHAYCLMSTHYHLLIRTPEPDLARGMQRLNGQYGQGFNRKHGSSGHVFESRYFSVLIERDAHLVELCRYLALNPVRAGACRDPASWRWSSYAAVLGRAPCPSFLAHEWLLSLFGANRGRARARLRAFVEDAADVAVP